VTTGNEKWSLEVVIHYDIGPAKLIGYLGEEHDNMVNMFSIS